MDQAHREADKFLNSIVEEVYNNLQAEELEATGFSVELFKSKSFKGQLQLQLRSLEENELLRQGEVDLYIVYRDVRNTNNLPSTKAAKVFVYIPDEASQLKEEVDDDIYQPQIVEFDLDNSAATAAKITEVIIDQFQQSKDLLEGMLKENS